MHAQEALRSGLVLKKFVLGAHPIIQWHIEKLKLDEIIRNHIKQDARVKLPCEKTIPVLVHNILTQPAPLYEIQDWLHPLDEGALNLESSQSLCIHDDRVGKALEDFYNGRHKEVFFRLALRAIKIFRLDCSQIHQDTTTVTFAGSYRGWHVPEHLCRGHNKDHRPDLKQLVLGTSVTADGAVPLVHQVYSGNQTDDRLHPANHQRLRKLLNRADFIYVADCKLASEANLRTLAGYGGRFVSVMPRTWKEDSSFREKVKAGGIQWKLILSRRNNRKPDSKIDRYYLAQGSFHTSHGYILHWIRSTQKAEQDALIRKTHLEESLDGLRSLQARLNRYAFKTLEGIEREYRKILANHGARQWIDIRLQSHQGFTIKRKKPGRPRINEAGEKVWTTSFSLAFTIRKDQLAKAAQQDGVFPLITNLAGCTPKKALQIYKFQPFLEKRHTQLKTYQEISPVFLKKPERVVGALHVQVMALMVATLIERQLKNAMRRQKIASLPIYPEERPCPSPSMFDIVRLFKGVERYCMEKHDEVTVFPAKLNSLQKQVLELLDIPVSLYH